MFDEMRALAAVAETGSVQKASDRLHLTQSAVSRQVQRLEEALGTKLLDRRTKPPMLTHAGKAALDRCRNILSAVDELKASTADRAEPAGPLRVGLAHSLADSGMAEPLHAVARRFPGVSLSLISDWTSDLVDAFNRGELDAAIVLKRTDADAIPAGATSRVLGAEDFLVVAGHQHVLPRRPSLAQLAAFPWVINPEGCGVRAALRTSVERTGKPFRIAAEVHDFDLKVALIARGLGIGLLPRQRLARHRQRRAFRAVQLPAGLQFRIPVTFLRAAYLGRQARAVDLLESAIEDWF